MTKNSMLLFALTLFVAMFLGACGEDHDHDSDDGKDGHGAHSEDGPNGGHIIELGSIGHMEVIHDDDAGHLTLFLTGSELKKPVAPDQPPVLKLMTDNGPLVLTLEDNSKAGISQFMVSHAALKGEEPNGRISIKINGKTFNSDLEDAHGH